MLRTTGYCAAVLLATAAAAWGIDLDGLPVLESGTVAAENALWIENPPERQFTSSKQVVVADLEGPAVITMIHFAYPQLAVAKPDEYHLDRSLLIQAWWDGEAEPSINCPLVDFFCDPAGLRDQVDTALVNKKRGFNAYFPMPFRKSGKIVLTYDGPKEPGQEMWSMMPCYSYVMYRKLDAIPADRGYFHAQWRQAAVLMGKYPYMAMEASGKGKFVGWNVTVRRPGSSYPVDMNEDFFIDGAETPAVSFQGIEDSFGFSWGFPEEENLFPLTGYWPFMTGAAAYRFFIDDAISFDRSLKILIRFGDSEKHFLNMFSRPGTELQLSSVCYWYQTEPHAAFPPMPPAAERAPAPEERFWPHTAPAAPTTAELRSRGVKFHTLCGVPGKEATFAEPGFRAAVLRGYSFDGWPPPVYHCWADDDELAIRLTVPRDTTGTIRLFVIDPDDFRGGRRQEVFVDDASLGVVKDFQDGRWLEHKVDSAMSADGELIVRAKDLTQESNAVISIIEFVGAKPVR